MKKGNVKQNSEKAGFGIAVCLSFFIGLFLQSCGSGVLDSTEELSNGYYFHNNSGIDRFIAPRSWGKTTPMIPSRIVKFREKDGYIIALREILVLSETGSRVKSGTFDYWILNTILPQVHGPLTKTEFLAKSNVLELSSELNLEK